MTSNAYSSESESWVKTETRHHLRRLRLLFGIRAGFGFWISVFVISLLPSPLPTVRAQSASTNRVLQLAGRDSHVHLPPEIIRGLKELTIEGGVRWDDLSDTWASVAGAEPAQDSTT